MRIIQHPPHHAQLNTIARALAAFVARLDAEARGRFDARKAARLILLANADSFEALTSADGDELLGELLAHAKRVAAERAEKGGAA